MIFVVTEQVMNGTVTMAVITSGIEAETFHDAVEILKQQRGFDKAIIKEETPEEFVYNLPQCFGIMKSEPLRMLSARAIE
jgi:hypothetical protein